MEDVQLPVEKASEPAENAHQPMKRLPDKEKTKKTNVTFSNAMDKSTIRSNASRVYKELLSEPPSNFTQLQRLQWLQKRRTVGLWVQCDKCDRWRYLPHVLDSHELPKKWFCTMNPDTSMASCSIPEAPLQLHDEEDLIHSEYSAGSLVLARLPGWPWWPAMVDDCPETEQYYWLDGFSDIPTHYNVVFFDNEVTRAWIAPSQLKPYGQNKHLLKTSIKNNAYNNRLDMSKAQLEDAMKLPHSKRLEKYSFISRYKGAIVSPTKVNRKQALQYQQRLKRKYNIELPNNFFESDEEFQSETQQTILNSNVIIVGSKKKVINNNEREETSLNLDVEKVKKESSLVVQVCTDKDDQSRDDQSQDDQSLDDQSQDDQSYDDQSQDDQSKDDQYNIYNDIANSVIEIKTILEENTSYPDDTRSQHSDDFDF